VEDGECRSWLSGELAALQGVSAVARGGSRARGTYRAESDWDFAIYHRAIFDPATLRAKGWPGKVSEIGGWGGGVINGGAWLTVDDAVSSLAYGRAALERRADITVAYANASRSLVEAAPARMAARGPGC
jgi:Nucleotidyltransferase domain